MNKNPDMSENEIKLGELAAVKRLERACMAGGWVAAQIQSDDVQEVLRYIDRLTEERDAAVADACRWNELCRQIDAGTFPSVVIEDAMEMGSGALELQVDASMAENGG